MGQPGRPASDLVRELVAGLDQPVTLRAVGIKRENLDEIANRSLSYQPVQLNPRPIKTVDDVKEILELRPGQAPLPPACRPPVPRCKRQVALRAAARQPSCATSGQR